MTEVFQDGEPVDPQKLRNLQSQIDAISIKTDSAYDLSTTTSKNIAVLSVMHLKAGIIEFENGLTAGLNSENIDTSWGADYAAAYTTVTPAGNLYKYGIRYSISGSKDSQKLNVWADKAVSGSVKFSWISAGKKTLPSA